MTDHTDPAVRESIDTGQPPPYMGGQGRDDAEVEDIGSAMLAIFTLGLLLGGILVTLAWWLS